MALLAVAHAVITSMTGRKNDHLCGRHSIFKHVLPQQGGLRLILCRCCLALGPQTICTVINGLTSSAC